MPALWAHPVAAIPLKRYRLVLSALIVGCMAPDLLYFIPGITYEGFGHTFLGLFIFTLPAGLASLWIFHKILKRPLFSLLPDEQQERVVGLIMDFRFEPSKQFVLVVISLFIGSLTHVVWDSFTHYHGWLVQNISFLSFPIINTSHGTLRLFKVLQHGSTIAGSIVLIYWYLKWLNKTPKRCVAPIYRLPNFCRFIVVGAIGLTSGFISVISGFVLVPNIVNLSRFSHFAVTSAKAGISCFLAELLIFSITWYIFKLKKKVILDIGTRNQ